MKKKKKEKGRCGQKGAEFVVGREEEKRRFNRGKLLDVYFSGFGCRA